MKKLLLVAFLIITAAHGFGQDFQVPKNLKMEKDEDFPKYNNDALKAIDWLAKTPYKKNDPKRIEVNSFLMRWMTGTPDVSIGVADYLSDLADNGDLIMSFMAGWSKYALETKDTDAVKSNLAGVEAVISFYKKNKEALGKNEAAEKFSKLKDDNKLEAFIKSKV